MRTFFSVLACPVSKSMGTFAFFFLPGFFALAAYDVIPLISRHIVGFIRAYLSLLCFTFISLLVLTAINDRFLEERYLPIISGAHRAAEEVVKAVCPTNLNVTCDALVEGLGYAHFFAQDVASHLGPYSRAILRIVRALTGHEYKEETLSDLLNLSHTFVIHSLRNLINWLDNGVKFTLCTVAGMNCHAKS